MIRWPQLERLFLEDAADFPTLDADSTEWVAGLGSDPGALVDLANRCAGALGPKDEDELAERFLAAYRLGRIVLRLLDEVDTASEIDGSLLERLFLEDAATFPSINSRDFGWIEHRGVDPVALVRLSNSCAKALGTSNDRFAAAALSAFRAGRVMLRLLRDEGSP